MTVAHRIRRGLRQIGVDLTRWPKESNEYLLHKALFNCRPDLLIDIGANSGQFVLASRGFGYRGPVVSFEPSSAAFERLQLTAAADPRWEVLHRAIGATDASVVLNIAGNSEASSSILPMLELHQRAAPESRYKSEEAVEMLRLDTWMTAEAQVQKRVALKIDVQGFERQVLEGARATMREVAAVRMELSTHHLYEGDWLWNDAANWLLAQGFALAGVAPGFVEPGSGVMLQFDAVFIR